MLDNLSYYFYASKVAQWEAFDQHKKMWFNLSPSLSRKREGGGTWQHLSGRWFVLFNGSILVIYLRSDNGQDLKSHLRIQNIDLRLEGEDLATLSHHTITWHDHNAPMKIRKSWFKHNNSPLWIPLPPLISFKRRSDGHAQFQNIINSLSLTRNSYSWGVSNNQTFLTSQSLNLLLSSSFRSIFASNECLKLWFSRNNRGKSLL